MQSVNVSGSEIVFGNRMLRKLLFAAGALVVLLMAMMLLSGGAQAADIYLDEPGYTCTGGEAWTAADNIFIKSGNIL